jgi:hypothetical protein
MLRQLPELLVTPYSAIVILPAVQQIHAQTLLKSHEPTLISPHHPQQETRDEEHTNLEKGNFKINVSVLFWYFRISIIARVPGRYRRVLPFGTGSPATHKSTLATKRGEEEGGYVVRRRGW